MHAGRQIKSQRKLYYPNLWEDQAMTDAKALADRLDAHAIRYANDYGYGVATDLKEAAAAVRTLAAPQALAATPAVGGELTHTRSCGYFDDEEGCTCCLEERKALATEQAMHAAWRKRAEEAEAALAAPPASPLRGSEALEPLARIGLWQDKYPDGPDCISDQSLQRYFTPDEVRAARAALAQPASPLRGRETVANAIREYCRGLTPAAVQNSHGVERIYYAGLSVYGLTDAILSASPPEQPAAALVTAMTAQGALEIAANIAEDRGWMGKPYPGIEIAKAIRDVAKKGYWTRDSALVSRTAPEPRGSSGEPIREDNYMSNDLDKGSDA